MIGSPASMPTHRPRLSVEAVVALYERQLSNGYWTWRCPSCPKPIPRHLTRCRRCEETT